MENLNDTLILQQMRSQMSLLNKKLEKEHILNEQLMRNAMKDKISSLRKERWYGLAVFILMIPCLYYLYVGLGLSLLFTAVTFIFFVLCITVTFKQWQQVKEEDFMSGNLCETVKKVARMYKHNSQWLFFGVPFAIIWISWFYYELAYLPNDNPRIQGALIGGCIGFIIGGCFGVHYYLKKQRILKDMMHQIENYTEDK